MLAVSGQQPKVLLITDVMREGVGGGGGLLKLFALEVGGGFPQYPINITTKIK